jgi:hypothetical protein
MNKARWMQNKEREIKIIIMLWTYRHEAKKSDAVCLCVIARMLPHPSTNKELQFETINHLFMIINSTLSSRMQAWEMNAKAFCTTLIESSNLIFSISSFCWMENNYHSY